MSSNLAPSLSIITVSYFTGDVLFAMLERALTCANSEVIVVNNGNPDAVNAKLADYQDQNKIKLIDGQGNVGFATACNLGAKQANAEVLLFLNPDSLIGESDSGENSATALLNQYQKLSETTLLGGRVLDDNGQNQRGMARNLLTPLTMLVEMSLLYRLFKGLAKYRLNLEQLPLTQPLTRIGAISGSCMMISAAFYQRLGGFDEGYFLHFEDLDLCQRVWRENGQVMIYNNAPFKHLKSSSEVSSQFVERHKYKGFCRYFKKFYPGTWASPLGWFFKAVFWARTTVKSG